MFCLFAWTKHVCESQPREVVVGLLLVSCFGRPSCIEREMERWQWKMAGRRMHVQGECVVTCVGKQQMDDEHLASQNEIIVARFDSWSLDQHSF